VKPVRPEHLAHLRCPDCGGGLALAAVRARSGEQIAEGDIGCSVCRREYPIVHGVPRFVSNDNYASGFGLEWTKHARTQYDSSTGVPISRDRFFDETGWPQHLAGELMLEAGSASGRFTEIAAETGAMIVSFDYSFAVEANYASNGDRPNVLIVQADIFAPPFEPGSFDKVFCFGVLQHTPDPRRAFESVVRMVRPGGSLATDIYKRTFFSTILHTKYVARLVTRRIDPSRLYRWVKRWVDLMWPLAGIIRRIPRVGPSINWRLLIADYSSIGLPAHLLKEWAYLDTFDMLAPRYDTPATLKTFRSWFDEADLEEIDVRYGHNGIQGRARGAMGERVGAAATGPK